MARPRSVPDETVYEAVLSLLRQGSVKAVTFSAVAERVNLAASSLAERYGSIAGLVRAARNASWDRLEAVTLQASAEASVDAKGALALLKAIGREGLPDLHIDPARAQAWRVQVLAALTLRLGSKSKAVILFTAWQGQVMWRDAGLEVPRLKEILKALS